MKTRFYLLITLLLSLSLLLVACGGETAEPAVEEPPVIVVEEPAVEEPVVEEPVVEEPVVEEPAFTEADLDTAVSAMLARMTAYNTIRPDALNEALAEEPPFILDVRRVPELEEKGHIPGAVHIPLSELHENLDKLPSFETPIVAYCAIGWRCTIAMTALQTLGWENSRALIGGSFGGWETAEYEIVDGFPPEAVVLNAADPESGLLAEVQEMMANIPDGFGVITTDDLFTRLIEEPDLLLIDVRSAAEVEENGIIESDNQMQIAIEEFIAMKDQWPQDKDEEIIVYCGTGHRSTMVMSILWLYDYTNVRSMKGGLAEWRTGGYPVLGGAEPEVDLDTAFANFIDNMVAYNTIRPAALNELLIEDPPPFILDVRRPAELEEQGHIEGAVHIPLTEIGDNLALLPGFDTPIVAYCAIGWRCTIAMTALGTMGWTDVKALIGGSFGGWVSEGYPVIEGPAVEAMVLNAADPDPALAKELGDMLRHVPQGFGVITTDDLAMELVEKPEMLLIDVRTEAEVEENGRIESEGQLLIPIQEFIERMDEWPAEDTEIVIYCGTGHRSTIAMTILWSYGYTDVRSMKGGLAQWDTDGYPVVEFAP
ncbi:MAG: rhodanese-like domain-containing protein [Chloroflexota bacterium]